MYTWCSAQEVNKESKTRNIGGVKWIMAGRPSKAIPAIIET